MVVLLNIAAVREYLKANPPTKEQIEERRQMIDAAVRSISDEKEICKRLNITYVPAVC